MFEDFSVGLETSPEAWMSFVAVQEDKYDVFWNIKKFFVIKPFSESASVLDPDLY